MADNQRLRVGHAHVFAGKANQPPHDIERVFTCLQHARQPVEAGVGVGATQGFMQGRDQVVMLLAALVVEQGAVLKRAFDGCGGDDALAGRRLAQQHRLPVPGR